jgi:segregation and condensation protein B
MEAALYVAGRPLDFNTLGRVIKTRSKKKIRQLSRLLMDLYKNREGALEVLELEDHRFVLQLKTDYSSKVRKLAVRPLLTDGPLKTLAYVAFRQPILQKQVIEVRGTHAYGHIKQLVEMDLLNRKKKGRNKILSATDYFADYFGFSHDNRTMKRQLRKVLDDITKVEPTAIED